MVVEQQNIGFARRVAEVIRAHAPEARIILYGSRARGDAQPDSDWDILVVTPRPMAQSVRRKAGDDIYDLQLEHDLYATVMWFDEATWRDTRKAESFFHASVQEVGIRL